MSVIEAGVAPRFELVPPMGIGPRLLAAVRVADGWISVEPHEIGTYGRIHWRFFIDCPAGTYASGDSWVENVPVGGDDWTRMAARALATVCAGIGEEDAGEVAECEWLPAPVDEWRREHAGELSDMVDDLGGE